MILLLGLVTVLAIFPLVPDPLRLSLKQRWSRALVATLGIRLEIHGETPPAGAMIVANHVSWVDIFAINALTPAAFISKAEVRQWPLIGWLAQHNDTVFLRRGSRGHARIVNTEIVRLMQSGKPVALFPEGTTTDGSHLLHFHGALLQPAIDAGAPIAPVAIRYLEADGALALAPAYIGEMSLVACITNIIAAHGLRARLTCLPPIRDDHGHRKVLNARLHAAIAAELG
ncbi:MAG: 1-acyl-sn-glycerol-3-phosphate acyltransferase [Rhodocyclaceae bacterium]|nr:1-acyl-sn-glycerol-3-phosphate acyltransferase [Rhodocyclaceae bacterium]